MVMIKPEKYVRKPFAVEAVVVTPDNIQEVAEWCGGTIETSEEYRDNYGRPTTEPYIRVPVRKPLSERQTRAYYDDWVLLGGMNDQPSGFKVYTPKAFEDSFEKQVERMAEVVSRMETRVARDDRDEELELPSVRVSNVNPLQPFTY